MPLLMTSQLEAPFDDITINAPLDDIKISAPLDDITISVPFNDITISAPFDDITVSAPFDDITIRGGDLPYLWFTVSLPHRVLTRLWHFTRHPTPRQ